MNTSINRIEMGSATVPETFHALDKEFNGIVEFIEKKARTPLPAISQPILRWFTWYSRRYIKRHFHSLRISRSDLPLTRSDLPMVLYTNHASWWDPLVGLVLKNELFPNRSAFAPIDSDALKRYKMLGKLGFFGVEQNSPRGAIQFLRSAEAILNGPNRLLVITPQSRFNDVRERPIHFRPGLGHLAARVEHALFLPMAVEYVFWEERLPEILLRFGQPIEIRRSPTATRTPKYWTTILEEKLSNTQDALATEAQRRDPTNFKSILRGDAGQGGIYDWWRALSAKLRGETFKKEHGAK